MLSKICGIKVNSNYYLYGMRLRGFAPWCQPMDGFIKREDDTSGKYHDLLVYDRALTEKELTEYELDFIAGIDSIEREVY